MSRRLSFDHLLALVSIAWLGGLCCAPALAGCAEVFWATALLLACNFGASVWIFLRRRQVLVATNLVQMALFGLLSYQLRQAFGPHHYVARQAPGLYDWAEFVVAHLLRATDLFDALDEYGLRLHGVRHASVASGIILVCLHANAELFLLSVFGRLLCRWWRKLAPLHEAPLERGRRMCALLMLSGAIMITYTILAVMQEWRRADWWLWPLDNLMRLLDVGDVMQTFDVELHRVDMNGWTRGYAIAFRFAAGLCLAYVMPWLRLWLLRGHWYTQEELLEFLAADQAVFRAMAAEALGAMGRESRAAVAPLRHALRHDSDRDVRCAAAAALGRIGPAAASAVEDLAWALASPHRSLRLRAARALGRIGPGARDALDELAYLGKYADDRRLQHAFFDAIRKIDFRRWASLQVQSIE